MKRATILSASAMSVVAVISMFLVPATGQEQDADKNAIALIGSRLNVNKKVEITFPIAGVIDEVEHPNVGDQVVQGGFVARLLDDVPQNRLEVATKKASSLVELNYAQAAKNHAKFRYDRAAQPNSSFSLAEKQERELELIRANLQVEKAQHDREVAILEQKLASVELGQYVVSARHTGEVTEVHKRIGGAIRQGDPMLTVTNLETVEAIGEIHYIDAQRVQKGDPVDLYIHFPDIDFELENRRFEGKVTGFGLEVDPLTQRLEVKIEIVNQLNDFEEYILREGVPVRTQVRPQGKPGATAASVRRTRR